MLNLAGTMDGGNQSTTMTFADVSSAALTRFGFPLLHGIPARSEVGQQNATCTRMPQPMYWFSDSDYARLSASGKFVKDTNPWAMQGNSPPAREAYPRRIECSRSKHGLVHTQSAPCANPVIHVDEECPTDELSESQVSDHMSDPSVLPSDGVLVHRPWLTVANNVGYYPAGPNPPIYLGLPSTRSSSLHSMGDNKGTSFRDEQDDVIRSWAQDLDCETVRRGNVYRDTHHNTPMTLVQGNVGTDDKVSHLYWKTTTSGYAALVQGNVGKECLDIIEKRDAKVLSLVGGRALQASSSEGAADQQESQSYDKLLPAPTSEDTALASAFAIVTELTTNLIKAFIKPDNHIYRP